MGVRPERDQPRGGHVPHRDHDSGVPSPGNGSPSLDELVARYTVAGTPWRWSTGVATLGKVGRAVVERHHHRIAAPLALSAVTRLVEHVNGVVEADDPP